MLTRSLAAVATLGVALVVSGHLAQPNADKEAVIDIVDDLYASISGPAGSHDFTQFKELFDEQGRLTAIVHTEAGDRIARMTPDEWVERSGAWINENGFYETGLHTKVEIFGGRRPRTGPPTTPSARRRPSPSPAASTPSRLLKDPASGKWKVLSILWDSETADPA